ncbi:hypothetical protein [Streptomyces sp. NPDC101115]|uniref:hypothetical protein n=1 Tax=Streptomyces sp. NPDC101115 TaxID=3366106 RepID=UPI0038057729
MSASPEDTGGREARVGLGPEEEPEFRPYRHPVNALRALDDFSTRSDQPIMKDLDVTAGPAA